MRGQIDSLSGIDIATIEAKDIHWQTGTGICISSGSGRNRTYRYRRGVLTDLGDIEEGLWYQLAEAVAKRCNEQELVEAHYEWEKVHNYTNSPRSQLRLDAMHSYINGLHDRPDWVDYIPFNRKYRPHVLEQAHIVTVINTCCGKPGEVTQEQIDRAGQGRIACPHCGRWSPFVICGEDETPPWVECWDATAE